MWIYQIGIKHNKRSRFTVPEIRNILRSGDYIIDVAYGRVGAFINAIEKELQRQLNCRMKEIRTMLSDTTNRALLSPKQMFDLEIAQGRVRGVLNKIEVKKHAKRNTLLGEKYYKTLYQQRLVTLGTKQKYSLARTIVAK